jgi:hypothetical protein
MNYFAVVHYTPSHNDPDLIEVTIAEAKKLGSSTREDDPGPSPYVAPNIYITEDGFPATSGELLAYCLRGELPKHQKFKRARRIRPEQREGLTRAIEYAAMDLLEHYQLATRAPGPQLTELVREILELDRPMHGAPREFAKRYYAAQIRAQDKSISMRQLARMVGVNVSTVKRWLDEPEDDPKSFRRQVADIRKHVRWLS